MYDRTGPLSRLKQCPRATGVDNTRVFVYQACGLARVRGSYGRFCVSPDVGSPLLVQDGRRTIRRPTADLPRPAAHRRIDRRAQRREREGRPADAGPFERGHDLGRIRRSL